ncbi:hypothetical protein [Aquabacter spiritensis]|uniref:Uncharacterized protein n=1 Tax=Aquabacter spiritensis TaxID=933073 RepID=A0A4V2UYQ6_9HYPH|nr:hypothetical protein [Aquabacter spiritensis]TCT08268.1 hypothetical protein EDC64_101791 [Aquabacter spiritensis]
MSLRAPRPDTLPPAKAASIDIEPRATRPSASQVEPPATRSYRSARLDAYGHQNQMRVADPERDRQQREHRER